ncbi:MAG TPA: hypothetical protein VFV51_10635 [Vicinamibacterales bacterium]|nr:hypothetical protein [Vicinamibacterales bacterium]
MNPLRNASLFALFGIVINAVPMVAGFAFAVRPSAVRLAMVRALTLMGVFVTLANVFSGAINVLIGLARQSPVAPEPPSFLYTAAAEIMVIPFTCFVFLALAWAGVAIGLRKPFDR